MPNAEIVYKITRIAKTLEDTPTDYGCSVQGLKRAVELFAKRFSSCFAKYKDSMTVGHINLELRRELDGKSAMACISMTGEMLFLTVPAAGIPDHWSHLANNLRHSMGQVSDVRLTALYQKLYADGWAKERTRPLSTRRMDEELRHAMMDCVAIETIERREGRIPSVPDD